MELHEKEAAVTELIENGKAAGKLSTQDIDSLIIEHDFEVGEIDKLYKLIEANGIEITGDVSETVVDEIQPPEDKAMSDLIKVYLNTIDKVPPLTPEEKAELAEKIANNDEAAKKRLKEANLRFVVNVVNKYSGGSIPLVDLIGVGNIGLEKAIDNFGYTNGFSSYVIWCIRQEITRIVAEHDNKFRISVATIEAMNKVDKVRSQLLQQNGCEPTDEEIAEVLEMSPEKVHETIKLLQMREATGTPADEEINDSGDFASEEADLRFDLKSKIAEKRDVLTPKEIQVLTLHYGLEDGHPKTLAEIGDELNVNMERIRQIEAKAIRKICRCNLTRRKRLKDYI